MTAIDSSVAVAAVSAWHPAHRRADPAAQGCTIAAHALVSMTDNFGYVWFVLGERFDEESAFRTITTLWANAVGLHHP